MKNAAQPKGCAQRQPSQEAQDENCGATGAKNRPRPLRTIQCWEQPSGEPIFAISWPLGCH
jgi:hypothetical protein